MAAFIPDSDSEDELPPGWEERATLDGLVYYANHNTQKTQWNHPRTNKKKRVSGALPFGWERRILEDGKVIYVHHEGKKTTYTDPRLAFAQEDDDEGGGNLRNFRQRFDASSTADQVLHGADLSAKTALVVGASPGSLGFETALSLARHGCRVFVASRDPAAAARAAAASDRSSSAGARCRFLEVDLRSLDSVKELASGLGSLFQELDILILSAGILPVDHRLTRDGLEETFQVNYLSQFLLMRLLKPQLRRSAAARIVVVSAESHRFSQISGPEDVRANLLSPESSRGFVPMAAYNDSKVLGVLMALEAGRRWWPCRISCMAVHPGNLVSTGLGRRWWAYRLLFGLVRPFAKSLQQASSSIVFAAAAHEMRNCSGLYINNCFPCRPSATALREDVAAKLWDVSTALLDQKLLPDFLPDRT